MFHFFPPPKTQLVEHFAVEALCTCIIFAHFLLHFPFLFPRRKLLAGKLNVFGLVLERSQLLQVSKLARTRYFLTGQGGEEVSYFTFSAIAMDSCEWCLFAIQKGSRELPASLAAVWVVLRRAIASDSLNQLQLQHKERATLWFFSLQKHKLLPGAHSLLLSAINAEPHHAALTPQVIKSPCRSYPVPINCTAQSLNRSLRHLLSSETYGTRKKPNIQTSGSP